jgi:hypothetical protein
MNDDSFEPINIGESYDSLNSTLLLDPLATIQEQPGNFEQAWDSNDADDAKIIDSLPVGLWTSFLQPMEEAYDDTDGWFEQPQSTDMSAASEATTRSPTDTAKSPPTASSTEKSLPTGKSPRRRGRPAYPSQRKSHNEIEARYRGTINAALKTLQQELPDINISGSSSSDQRPRGNPTKADVMVSAASFIRTLKEENCRLVEENSRLRAVIMSNKLPSSYESMGQ